MVFKLWPIKVSNDSPCLSSFPHWWVCMCPPTPFFFFCFSVSDPDQWFWMVLTERELIKDKKIFQTKNDLSTIHRCTCYSLWYPWTLIIMIFTVKHHYNCWCFFEYCVSETVGLFNLFLPMKESCCELFLQEILYSSSSLSLSTPSLPFFQPCKWYCLRISLGCTMDSCSINSVLLHQTDLKLKDPYNLWFFLKDCTICYVNLCIFLFCYLNCMPFQRCLITSVAGLKRRKILMKEWWLFFRSHPTDSWQTFLKIMSVPTVVSRTMFPNFSASEWNPWLPQSL